MSSRAVAELLPFADVVGALAANTARFARALREAPDPDARAVGQWSIRDVAKHTAWGTENYLLWTSGEARPDLDDLRNMPQWNVAKVRGVEEGDLTRLAERVEDATTRLVGYARSLDSDSSVPWYCGISLPINVSLSMRLIEVVLHGHDVARASKQRWDIDARDALFVAYAGAYIAPYLVKPEEADFTATLDVRFRGGMPVLFRIADTRVELDVVEHARADCHVSADPRAWILTSSGRASRTLAALRGQIVAWGKRPWLPLRFQKVFASA